MTSIPTSFAEADILFQAAFLVWYEDCIKELLNVDFLELKEDDQKVYFFRYQKTMLAMLEQKLRQA